MPIKKDSTMLRVNSKKFLVAMANAELEPMELAKAAGISKNIVYSMRRGYYTKPKYIGAAAKALNVTVTDIVEN